MSASPLTALSSSKRDRNTLWSMVLKAALKSRSTSLSNAKNENVFGNCKNGYGLIDSLLDGAHVSYILIDVFPLA